MSPLPEPTIAPPGRAHLNELLPFLEFAEKHPVGTSCTAVVEIYASHGAYARVGDVLIYIPLRSMGDPAPKSARSAFNIGDALTAVIVGYVAERRNVDASLPGMAAAIAATAQLSPSKVSATRKSKPTEIAVGEPLSTIGSKPTRRAAPKNPPLVSIEAPEPESKTSGRSVPAGAKQAVAEPSKPAKRTATPQRSKPVAAKRVAAKRVAAKPVVSKAAKAVKKAAPRRPPVS